MSHTGSAFLAYFYFDFKDTAKQDLRALLSSLLVQLSDQSDIFCNALTSMYATHSQGSEQPAVNSLGIGRGNPRVFKWYPYPYPLKPLPLSKGEGFGRVRVRVPQGMRGMKYP
jgi:hypothetical protein